MRIIEFEGKFYVKDKAGFPSASDDSVWSVTSLVFKFCGHDSREQAQETMRKAMNMKAEEKARKDQEKAFELKAADKEDHFNRRVKRWWLK